MARIIVRIVTMTKHDANSSSGPAPPGDGAHEFKVTDQMVRAGEAVIVESGALALPELGHHALVREILEAELSVAPFWNKAARY